VIVAREQKAGAQKGWRQVMRAEEILRKLRSRAKLEKEKVDVRGKYTTTASQSFQNANHILRLHIFFP
jgi:hypothetical protein